MKRDRVHLEKNTIPAEKEGFFKQSSKISRKEIIRESLEKLAIEAIRSQEFGKIKQALGNESSDEAAEECFRMCIEDLKKKGVINRMVERYIENIRSERLENKGQASLSKNS